MELYITELSKNLINVFLIIYMVISFICCIRKSEDSRKPFYIIQNILMLLTQFLCFLQIETRTGQITYLFYYAICAIVLISTMVLFGVIYPDGNTLIINNMCMMLMLGLVLLIRIDSGKAVRQLFIVIFSLVIAFFVPKIIAEWDSLKYIPFVYAIVGIAALLIVLILGSVTNGSKISFTIVGVTFQPSELVKILFVLFIAAAFYESVSFKQVILTALLAGAHIIILVISKDLGSAAIYFVVYLCMLVVATGNILYLFIGTFMGCSAAVVAYHLFTHVQNRVQAFLDPWSSIDSIGYQITQSLFAISSGGWFGLGLFCGSPQDIPYVEDDFIFSALAQELGIISAVCVCLICVSTFIMILKQSYYMRNLFERLLSFGFAVTYIFQIFLTVGGGSKFIPLTGVTFPLVSYGGSSVLTTIIMFFAVEGCQISHIERRRETIINQRRNRYE